MISWGLVLMAWCAVVRFQCPHSFITPHSVVSIMGGGAWRGREFFLAYRHGAELGKQTAEGKDFRSIWLLGSCVWSVGDYRFAAVSVRHGSPGGG
jgi:hypothetical protein